LNTNFFHNQAKARVTWNNFKEIEQETGTKILELQGLK
jgi:hypothetical protein